MYIPFTRTLILSAAIFSLPAFSLADARQVTLPEAFTLALAQNPKLVAMGNSLKAAREKEGSARSHLRPKISLEERYMRTDNPTYAFSSKLNQGRFESSDFAVTSLNQPDDIDDFMTTVSFSQALYSREASLGVRMARTRSEAMSLDYERSREEVLLDVIEAYVGGETARQYLTAAEKGLEDANAHLKIARSRVEAGLGLESDLLRARVSVREGEERVVTARKNVSLADRALGLNLGLDGPAEAAQKTVPVPDVRELPFYEEAALQRNDLLAMARKVHNAELNVSLSSARFTPVVGLGGSYQINSHEGPFDKEGDSYQVSAFIRWDLYSGGLKSHAGSDARYTLMEAESYYDGLVKEILFRVNEAYLNVQEASRSIELASSRLSLAEETARLMEKRFENSLATVVELLDAQTSLDTARADLVAKTNSHLISLARLMFQSGLIEQAYVKEN